MSKIGLKNSFFSSGSYDDSHAASALALYIALPMCKISFVKREDFEDEKYAGSKLGGWVEHISEFSLSK